MSKRGHSNAFAHLTEQWPNNPDKAKIPMEGGSTVFTVKELPPLALGKEEWREIGKQMDWMGEIVLFRHVTDGGAVYLTDNHNFAQANVIVRLDGDQPELVDCRVKI
jgi:hypothetical protein